MKIPRDLSGADLISILSRNFGYRRLHQVGSHVILETDSPRHHRIAIPDHNPLRIGTLNSILRAVASAQGIDKKDIARLL
jgi:predicted RNA binding protein YcfA (HicA-like mRNA interferase family)